jgi:hypothetical protein
MSFLYIFEFYIRNDADLTNSNILHSFFRTLAQQGHYVSGSDWNHISHIRHKILHDPTYTFSEQESKVDPESLFVPAVSPTLDTDVQRFLQKDTEELDICLHSTTRDSDLKYFDCSITITPEEGAISLVFGDPLEYPLFGHMLAVLAIVYNFWHPFYGYLDACGDPPPTSRADALSENIRYLYYINLFGPELVQKIGRKRLLQAPSWCKQPLEDGGMLLVPYIHFNPEELPPNMQQNGSLKATAAYLHLIDHLPDEDDEPEDEE